MVFIQVFYILSMMHLMHGMGIEYLFDKTHLWYVNRMQLKLP